MLQQALAGLDRTGTPLVAYDGKVLFPAGASDDIGIYYFIPKIAVSLHLSINQAINVFFIGLLLVSLILGTIGLFLLFKKWLSRLVALVGLLGLGLFSLKVGDIYLTYVYTVVSIIPLFLYFMQSKKLNSLFVIFILLSGIGIGVAHYLRSYAGMAVLIFMLFLGFFYLKLTLKEKLALAMSLVLGILVPVFYANILLDHRNDYLANHQSNYERTIASHPFWHSIYIGFGFLDNNLGIKYKDEVAIEKVRQISPKTPFLSKRYEAILENEVLGLLKKDREFVIYTVFAKLGVILFFLLVFANIGLLAAILYPKGWQLEIAFLGAMGFNSLFGILAIPVRSYLMGFIALAVMYGIVSINYAIESGVWQDIKNLRQRIRTA